MLPFYLYAIHNRYLTYIKLRSKNFLLIRFFTVCPKEYERGWLTFKHREKLFIKIHSQKQRSGEWEGEKRRKEREKKREGFKKYAEHVCDSLSIYLSSWLSIYHSGYLYMYIQFETRKVQKFRRLNLHYPTPLGRVLQSELVCMFVCVFVLNHGLRERFIKSHLLNFFLNQGWMTLRQTK